MVNYTVDRNSGPFARSTTIAVLDSGGSSVATIPITQNGVANPATGLTFVPLTPCRVMETRTAANGGDNVNRGGSFGPPSLSPGETRRLALPLSTACNIPSGAKAYVVNLTLLPKGQGANYVTVFPADESLPRYRSIAEPDGQIVANSAIVRADSVAGAISVFSSDNSDLLIDVTGYFTDNRSVSNLVFYPLKPCRVIETRPNERGPSLFGPPSLAASVTRSFRLPASPDCAVPSGAAAYSMTVTAVPQNTLYYMTVWPADKPQPIVSSLNSFDGRIIPNSVIIPASPDGSISVFASNGTNFFVDINGYFAPDNGSTGLFYYPVTQCVAADSSDKTYTAQFGGPSYQGGAARTLPIPGSPFCAGVPSSAKGYALNVTANPHGGQLAFVTAFPTGQSLPLASMLNDFQKQIVTNSAIIPAGSNGAIDVYASDMSDLAVQITGYFR